MVHADLVKARIENWKIDSDQENNPYPSHKGSRSIVCSVRLHQTILNIPGGKKSNKQSNTL
jgi:hypothetical protein